MAKGDDVELLARTAGGDEQAFKDLLNVHAGAVRAYVRWLTKNDDLADDIVQEVFFKVWRHAKRYRADKASVRTWLRKIAHNATMDALRRQTTRETLSDPLPAAAENDDGDAAEVHRVLRALPINQRTAVSLCLLDSFTAKEAAHIMGLGERAVESLIARTRRTLREHFSS